MSEDSAVWDQAKSTIAIGDTVSCVVREHRPFGILVSLQHRPVSGVIERIRMAADGYATPDEYPPVGSIITATVLGFRDYSRQVELVLPSKAAMLERTAHSERFVEVGLRIGDDGRLQFFGIDELNKEISEGSAIARLEEGRAIMLKTDESDDRVKMQLRGFSIRAVVREGHQPTS